MADRPETEFHAYDEVRREDDKFGKEIRYVLVGAKGAVQFLYRKAPETYPEDWPDVLKGDQAYDLGYHSPVAMYDGQEPRECDVFETHRHLGTTECYYDGSGLRASPVLGILVEFGEPAMWEYLRDYYFEVFYGPSGDDVTIEAAGFGQILQKMGEVLGHMEEEPPGRSEPG